MLEAVSGVMHLRFGKNYNIILCRILFFIFVLDYGIVNCVLGLLLGLVNVYSIF